MPIVSSVVAWDQAQQDGRRWIREVHTDQHGVTYVRDYLAPAGLVIADGFPAVVALLDASLIDTEIAKDLQDIYQHGPDASPTLQYATFAQAGAAVRAIYPSLTKVQAIAVGAFLSTLTGPQLTSLFGVSGAGLTALQSRLALKATQWADLQAASGE